MSFCVSAFVLAVKYEAGSTDQFYFEKPVQVGVGLAGQRKSH